MTTQEVVTTTRPAVTGRPEPRRLRPRTATAVAALSTGALLWLSFFPINQGWLAWVALVPLLTLVRSTASRRWVYLSAWAGGLAFYWPALQWMRVADERMYFTWAALATYCSLSFPAAIYFIRLLGRRTRLPFVIAVPVVWTALEFFRSFAATGFAWYLLAHSQHDYLTIIQIADVTGAWGISFLIAFVNACLCQAYLASRGRPIVSRSGLIAGGGVAGIGLAGTIGYGVWRTGQTAFEPGPVIALVQGNLPQYLRNNPTTLESVLSHYVALCDVAGKSKPALIVTPETSLPFRWEEAWPDGATADTRTLCRNVSQRFGAPVLIGLNSEITGCDKVTRRYNSAVLVDERGHAVARYDKIHRVPFGEYVPLRDVFPFLNWFAPYDFDYSVSPGSGPTRFPLGRESREDGPSHFGVVICYEDTDSDMARPYGGADGRPPADFLLNISNDGWFEGTSEHDEHLAICRFRAVECRRPVGRAVNMGISAIIDGNGRVLAPKVVREESVPSGIGSEKCAATVWQAGPESESMAVGRWGDFKKNAYVLLATVPLDGRTSFYARMGDWLPWLCWIVLGASFLVAWRSPAAGTVGGPGPATPAAAH